MAEGIRLARDVGGVKVTLVFPWAVKSYPTEKPSAAPEMEAKLYLNLCLKVLLAGVIVTVMLLPIVMVVADKVGVVALGTVVRDTVVVVLGTVKEFPATPLTLLLIAKPRVILLFPSLSWVISLLAV